MKMIGSTKTVWICYAMARLYLLIAVFMSGVYPQSSFLFKNVKRIGDLQPLNPVAEEGKSFNMTCELYSTYQGPHNSNDIVMRLSGNYIPSQYFDLVDNQTVNVEIPASMLKGRRQIIQCCLLDCANISNYIMMQSIAVGRKPLMPTHFLCYVEKFRLFCKWHPMNPTNYTNLRTTTAVSFYDQYKERLVLNIDYYGNSTNWMEVALLGDSAYDGINTEGYGGLEFGETYHIKIHVENVLGSFASEFFEINTTRIEKVDNVSDIQVKQLRSHEIELTWQAPSTHTPIEYHVTYQRVGQPETQKSMNLLENHFILEHVKAMADYELHVGVKSILNDNDDAWSVQKKFFSTQADVPEKNPEVSPHAEIVPCGDDCRVITIRWKGLDFEDYNSLPSALSYLVTVHSTYNCVTYPTPRPLIRTWHDLNVHQFVFNAHNECEINYTVTAENNIGTAKQMPVTHYIRKQSQVLPSPQIAVEASEDDRVSYRVWFPKADISDAVTKVTLFWCLGTYHSMDCEDGDLNWLIIPHSADSLNNSYSLTLDGDTHYGQHLYGLAVATTTKDSALQWASCTFDARKAPRTPAIHLHSNQPHSAVSLDIKSQTCVPSTGFADYYSVFYCYVEENTDECTGALYNETVNGQENEVLITDLHPGRKVKIWAVGYGQAEMASEKSEILYHVITESWASPSALGGIFIVSLILFILAMAGAVSACIYCNKCRKWWKRGIEIILPEGHETVGFIFDHQSKIQIPDPSYSFVRDDNNLYSPYSYAMDNLGHERMPLQIRIPPNDTNLDEVFETNNVESKLLCLQNYNYKGIEDVSGDLHQPHVVSCYQISPGFELKDHNPDKPKSVKKSSFDSGYTTSPTSGYSPPIQEANVKYSPVLAMSKLAPEEKSDSGYIQLDGSDTNCYSPNSNRTKSSSIPDVSRTTPSEVYVSHNCNLSTDSGLGQIDGQNSQENRRLSYVSLPESKDKMCSLESLGCVPATNKQTTSDISKESPLDSANTYIEHSKFFQEEKEYCVDHENVDTSVSNPSDYVEHQNMSPSVSNPSDYVEHQDVDSSVSNSSDYVEHQNVDSSVSNSSDYVEHNNMDSSVPSCIDNQSLNDNGYINHNDMVSYLKSCTVDKSSNPSDYVEHNNVDSSVPHHSDYVEHNNVDQSVPHHSDYVEHNNVDSSVPYHSDYVEHNNLESSVPYHSDYVEHQNGLISKDMSCQSMC